MSHTTSSIEFRVGDTFGLSGYLKTSAPGELTAYAQIFDAKGVEIAELTAVVAAVESPPPSPYADYTHTLVITCDDATDAWPVAALSTNVLVVDGSGNKVSTAAYTIRMTSQLSRVE